jgi:hypothetical protein
MIQYKRVFFLVRHCLRSTSNEVDLCDGQPGGRPTPPLPYAGPDWNTPPYFCTAGGLQRISSLGTYLADKTNEEYELQFDRIVADTVYRDADTALALSVALGISSVQYQPELFHPDILCPLTNDYRLETAARVEKKFHEVPMPGNLNDTLTALRAVLLLEQPPETNNDTAVVGAPDEDDSNSTTTTTTTSSPVFDDANPRVLVNPETNETCLSGAINTVKLFAQQLFYARASGIAYRTTNFTNPSIYTPWISYLRHLLDTDTVAAALRGSILIQYMLHAKQSTIMVGHDTDINALATVLELNYTLPEYGLTAAPPGSGIMIGVTRGGAVEVKYLYPTFTYDPTNATNVSMTMQWQSLREFRSVQDLSRRIRIQLDEEYGDEVAQCYDRLNDAKLLNGSYGSSSSSSSPFSWSWHSSGPSLVVVLVLMSAFFCFLCRQHRREKPHRPPPLHTAIDRCNTANGNNKAKSDEYGAVLPDLL